MSLLKPAYKNLKTTSYEGSIEDVE
ncbi:hypothetical protein DDE83_009125 [Stemphylium lycopersici]|uniref:Uncharacterized protein n=1 Tax=Stemphylium lycopersici TaxID=183478 RepID=A0A364MRQ6_STELY|nr:hypothetical protein DDE83_009125 [Stemphylium lycopersici]